MFFFFLFVYYTNQIFIDDTDDEIAANVIIYKENFQEDYNIGLIL